MKQFLTPPILPKIPSIASQLRQMRVGEQARLEIVGRSMSSYQESRSRLRTENVGDWTHEFTEDGRAIIITRVS